MSYKEKLFSRLKENLGKYFPSEALKIVKVDMISELYKDTLETRTYKYILKGTTSKVLYAKCFSNEKMKKLKQMLRIKEFNKYKDKIKIPEIYDFFEDLNTIVVEGVKGTELSRLVPIYLLPGLRTFYFKKVERALEETARAVANLHCFTQKKISGKILTRNFNDLKLGNVLFDGKNVKIVDFEMEETTYMEDVAAFLVSLDMLQKFPYISQKDISKVKNLFYKKYSANINWKIDTMLLKALIEKKMSEILKTLENKNARRGTGFFEKIIIEWNACYIRNKLKTPNSLQTF